MLVFQFSFLQSPTDNRAPRRPRARAVGGGPNRNPTNRPAASVSALVLPLPRSCHRTQAGGPPRLPPTMPRFLNPQGPGHGPRSPTIQTPFSLRSAVDVSVQWSRSAPGPSWAVAWGIRPPGCPFFFRSFFALSHCSTRATAHACAAGHAAAALHPTPTERTVAGAPTSARTTTRLRTASVSLLNHPSPPLPRY